MPDSEIVQIPLIIEQIRFEQFLKTQFIEMLRFFSPEEIGQKQPHAHRRQAGNPQMAIGDLLNHLHPLFHLIRKCKIGEALNDKNQSNQTE